MCRKHEGDEKLNIFVKNPLEGSHLEDLSEDGIIVLTGSYVNVKRV